MCRPLVVSRNPIVTVLVLSLFEKSVVTKSRLNYLFANFRIFSHRSQHSDNVDSNVSSEKSLRTSRPTWDSSLAPSAPCKKLSKLTSSPCLKVWTLPRQLLEELLICFFSRHQLVCYPWQACHHSTQGHATCSSSPWRTLIDSSNILSFELVSVL